MKKLFKKSYIILAIDLLLIPAMIFCEWLSDYMLSKPAVCAWVRLGGKCVTCGGTHFVNSILNGHIKEAFFYNQFLFVLLILLCVVLVLLNLNWLFNINWAKKGLKMIFSIPSLIVLVLFMLAFFFVRNIPVFVRVTEIIF